MAQRKSRPRFDPKKPLVRARTRIGKLDAPAFISELRELHEQAEDPDVERMPGDDELYGALRYAETHANKLKDKDRAHAACTRAKLWEYLREQTDLHQLNAVNDARESGVEWAALAAPLAVNTGTAAYNKAKRLQTVTITDTTIRRTPAAANEAQRRLAEAAAQERRRIEAAQRRHHLVQAIARSLLAQRNNLASADEADYWLDQIEAVLEDCETPTQQLSLDRYLGATVRALRKLTPGDLPLEHAAETKRALAAAAALFSGQ
ncbi:hypothetical protein [Streptomyces sp. NPDC048639]|uniref:hypothetical protein n=1 Tax=Streptomyces sp. NPDC048639 TaxID=3365581 RepID=UPI003715A150